MLRNVSAFSRSSSGGGGAAARVAVEATANVTMSRETSARSRVLIVMARLYSYPPRPSHCSSPSVSQGT